jgi:hypothetical protein
VPDPQVRAISGTNHDATRLAGPRPPTFETGISDIYILDKSLVRCRTSNKCDIHRPPRGEKGSQGRWYFVSRGTEVGIFNEWYVHLDFSFSPLNNYCRDEVQKVTNGVTGAHQQRVKSEALAYTQFKRALLRGNVEIIE